MWLVMVVVVERGWMQDETKSTGGDTTTVGYYFILSLQLGDLWKTFLVPTLVRTLLLTQRQSCHWALLFLWRLDFPFAINLATETFLTAGSWDCQTHNDCFISVCYAAADLQMKKKIRERGSNRLDRISISPALHLVISSSSSSSSGGNKLVDFLSCYSITS